jgi:hypothetical protein
VGNAFFDEFRIVRHAGNIDALVVDIHWTHLQMGFMEEALRR